MNVVPADLRAAKARAGIPLFVIAGRLRIHPVRLGQMLNGRRPLPQGVARRMLQVIEQAASDRIGTA